ncbi:MAG: hypothetical protein ACYSUQ_07345 [Planctomycetota bacterium]
MDDPIPRAAGRGHGALARTLTALVLIGVSFGYVEAAVVVYLRALYEPMRGSLYSNLTGGELFPLLRMDQLEAQGAEHVRRLLTELGREAATLVVLVGVALAVARSFRQWFAAFLVAFGLWDVFYYVFLKVLLDWPPSLLTWDLLFLLPLPWVGPVIAPILVALTMVAAGVLALWRESVGRPMLLRWFHWTAAVAGASVIVTSFCWDYRNITAGGEPNPFAWPIFAVGLALGIAAFLHALRPRSGIIPRPFRSTAECGRPGGR